MSWFSPKSSPQRRPLPAPKMERVVLEEVWSDERGMLAVKRKDGQFNFYGDLDVITSDGVPIADQPKIRHRINQAFLSIIEAKRRET